MHTNELCSRRAGTIANKFSPYLHTYIKEKYSCFISPPVLLGRQKTKDMFRMSCIQLFLGIIYSSRVTSITYTCDNGIEIKGISADDCRNYLLDGLLPLICQGHNNIFNSGKFF